MRTSIVSGNFAAAAAIGTDPTVAAIGAAQDVVLGEGRDVVQLAAAALEHGDHGDHGDHLEVKLGAAVAQAFTTGPPCARRGPRRGAARARRGPDRYPGG